MDVYQILWLYLTSFAYVKNEIKHVYRTRKLNTLVLLLDFEVHVLSNIPFLSYSLKISTAEMKRNRMDAMTYWRKYNA